MVQFVFKINARRVDKKFRDVIDFIRLKIPKLTRGEAIWGAKYARDIAPHDSGSLKQALLARKGKTKTTWSIVSYQPKGQRNRPYHLWMHNFGRYHISDRIQSGEPRYMFKTFEKLMEKFPRTVGRELRKTIRR